MLPLQSLSLSLQYHWAVSRGGGAFVSTVLLGYSDALVSSVCIPWQRPFLASEAAFFFYLSVAVL